MAIAATCTGSRPRVVASIAGSLATLALAGLAGGCAAASPDGQPAKPAAPAVAPAVLTTLGNSYLTVAAQANHTLDPAEDGFSDSVRDGDIATADADLRAQAKSEHWFDAHLAKISFPPTIAAVAQSLISDNQVRAALTLTEAQSTSVAELKSYTSRINRANATVVAGVKALRRALGLPPPKEES